jgi:hypothetical protein
MGDPLFEQIARMAHEHAGASVADLIHADRRAADEHAARRLQATQATQARASAAGHRLPALDARAHRPGRVVRDGFRPPVISERRGHVERFRASMQRRGNLDADPREITETMWQAGRLAMDADTWRLAVAALPPLVQVVIFRAYTTPTRELFAALDAAGYKRRAPSPALTEADLDRPAWDIDNASHRKALALLCVLLAASERTTRPGFGRLVSGYGLGAFATVIPNPIPYRPNRGTGARACPGDSAARYGYEAIRAHARDARGLPRGALPILHVWRAAFGLALTDVHQPDAGASIAAHERGSDGRWALSQYWFGLDALWSRWSVRRRRLVQAPDVSAWLGIETDEIDGSEWGAFVQWVDARRRAAHDEGEAPADVVGAAAADYASAEHAAIRAHKRRDLKASIAASMRARSLRLFLETIAPSQAFEAKRRALDARGILAASQALAADLARMRN